jgi:hypothetical protein
VIGFCYSKLLCVISIGMSQRLPDLLHSTHEKEIINAMEEDPTALKQRYGCYDCLPIHYECVDQCRSSIILKCIELYPESLAQTDYRGYQPLHLVLPLIGIKPLIVY